MRKTLQGLQNSYSLDLRSLALARVLLATVLIADWFYRFINCFDFYSDWGVLPRGPLISEFANSYFFSVFNVAGKPYYIAALLILGFLFHLSFLIGYKTRLSNIISWIFFVSLSARMPIVSHAGDDLMRLGLFWMIFLPAGEFYSMDRALLKDEPRSPPTLFNVSSLAFLTQLIFVYFFTALIKLHPAWTTEASAIYLSLQLDQFLTPLGEIIKQAPYATTQFLTRIVWFIELFIPLFLLLPYKNTFFRYLAVITFIGFHFGLFLTFKLGNFPWVCMAYWTAFLPSHFWEKILSWLKVKQEKLVIYYDAECKLCHKMSYVLKTFLVLPFVQIHPAKDSPEKDLVRKNNSWLVINGQRKLYKFEAFAELISVSVFCFLKKILLGANTLQWGTKVYETVANNRPLYLGWLNFIHRSYFHMLDRKWYIQFFVAICFIVAIFWNIALLDKNKIKIPEPVQIIGSVLRLHQHWVMFAPYPAFEDGWVVVEGELANGKKWDIFNDQPISFERPVSMSSMFKNSLWRKYLNNLRTSEYYGYRLYFGRYLCRLWNDKRSADEIVNTFKVYFILDRTVEYGKPTEPLSHEMLWSHGCFIK